MPGGDAAKEHAKPGKTTADHGDTFAHTGACVHDQLNTTTRPLPKKRTVKRLRLQ